MDCNADWETLQAHPFRVEKEVRDQSSGKPRVVGSKLTVIFFADDETSFIMRW